MTRVEHLAEDDKQEKYGFKCNWPSCACEMYGGYKSVCKNRKKHINDPLKPAKQDSLAL